MSKQFAKGQQHVETVLKRFEHDRERAEGAVPSGGGGESLVDDAPPIVGDGVVHRRLEGVGLKTLSPGTENPFPWLAEMMDIKKEQNFFEGKVTEYQKASALEDTGYSDDDL